MLSRWIESAFDGNNRSPRSTQASIHMQLAHRDITSLDYSTLLLLDQDKFDGIPLDILNKLPSFQNGSREDRCAICLGAYQLHDDLVQLPCECFPVFHRECIFEWLKRNKTCPLCKTNLRELFKINGLI
ncbi:hypothetical protein RCL1_000877 [Eukaryota sp. TZLM3-RCL]